jgi:hypothetical protein
MGCWLYTLKNITFFSDNCFTAQFCITFTTAFLTSAMAFYGYALQHYFKLLFIKSFAAVTASSHSLSVPAAL